MFLSSIFVFKKKMSQQDDFSHHDQFSSRKQKRRSHHISLAKKRSKTQLPPLKKASSGLFPNSYLKEKNYSRVMEHASRGFKNPQRIRELRDHYENRLWEGTVSPSRWGDRQNNQMQAQILAAAHDDVQHNNLKMGAIRRANFLFTPHPTITRPLFEHTLDESVLRKRRRFARGSSPDINRGRKTSSRFYTKKRKGHVRVPWKKRTKNYHAWHKIRTKKRVKSQARSFDSFLKKSTDAPWVGHFKNRGRVKVRSNTRVPQTARSKMSRSPLYVKAKNYNN